MAIQITSIDHLTHDDIRRLARDAYAAHKQLSDCPFEANSLHANRWRREFIALELQEADALV
jgi:hypothetical protein